MNTIKTVAFTGGGSGGHTSPAIAVIRSIQESYKNIDCIYIGSKTGIEKQEAQNNNIEYHEISCGKLRRYFSVENFIDVFKIISGIFRSFIILQKKKPNILFATGGFVCVPVCIAAFLLKIPIILHEQTATFGLANKICSYMSCHIILSFKDSFKYIHKRHHEKCIVLGNPIRKELLHGCSDDFFKIFSVPRNRPILYVTGGALGSSSINELLKRNIIEVSETFSVIHQYGKNEQIKKEIEIILKDKKNVYYTAQAYFPADILKHIYSSISVLFGRSGASTVNELLILGIPSILIPLKNCANNEQFINAQILEKKDRTIILKEHCTNEEFISALNSISAKKRTHMIKEMCFNISAGKYA